MPQEIPIDVVQNVVLKFNNIIENGPSTVSFLKDVAKHTKTAEKAIASMKRSFQQTSKAMATASAGQNKLIRGQSKIAAVYRTVNQRIREQNKQLKENNRSLRDQDRGVRRVGLSMRQLAGGAALYGLFRRFKELADSAINASVLAGPQLGQQISRALPKGISSTSALQFFGEALKGSAALQLRGSDQSTKALMAIFERTKVLGAQGSGALVGEFLKSFEGERDRLQSFFRAVTTDGVESAIRQFSTQQNLLAGQQILNASAISEGAKAGTLDPVTQAGVKLKETFESLNATLDETIKVLAEVALPALKKFNELSPTTQAAIVGAGAAGTFGSNFLTGLGGGLLGAGSKGILKGLGRGLGAGGRGLGRGVTVIGRGLGTLPLANAWAHAVEGLGAAAPGALAVGAPAVASGSLWTLGRSYQTAKLERTALGRLEMDQGRTGLFDVANLNKERATTELQKIRAHRQQLEANLLAMPISTGMKPGWFSPDLPEVDPQQVARLREQIASLKKQEQELKSRQTEMQPAGDLLPRASEAFQSAIGKVQDALAKGAKAAKDYAAEQKRQQQIAKYLRRQDAALNQDVAESSSQVKALEYALASNTPLGTIGAMPQLGAYQQALRETLAKQQAVLESIDETQKDGQIEANKQRARMLQTQIELRDSQRAMMNAVLDSVLEQAFNAGAFQKIIISREQNLAAGLAKGIISPGLAPFTGSVGPSQNRQPVHAQDLLGLGNGSLDSATNLTSKQGRSAKSTPKSSPQNSSDAMKGLAEAARKLIPFLEAIENGELESQVERQRPSGLGGRVTQRTNLGTRG